MTYGARQSLRWPFVFFIARFGQEAWMLAAPAGHEHFAFVSHENNAIFMIQLTIRFEFSRAFTYSFTTLGSFGVVAWLSSRNDERTLLDGWAGLGSRHPAAAITPWS